MLQFIMNIFGDCSIRVFWLLFTVLATVADMHCESSDDINIHLSFSFQYRSVNMHLNLPTIVTLYYD